MRATDWALAVVCALIAASGPIMALVEYERATKEDALAAVTGERPAPDFEFRAPWRLGLLLGVIVVGVLGTLVALRVSWQPRVRAVTRRLVLQLLAGMTLLDLAFLADTRWLADVGHTGRAASVVWLYTLAAVLVGGALLRLVEVERAFAPAPKRS